MKNASVLLLVILLTSCISYEAREYAIPIRQVDNSVGKLWLISPEGTRECTATMLSPRIVVTAAHCTYSIDSNIEYLFAPGYDWSSTPFGVIDIKEVYTEPCFADGNLACDFSIVVLSNPVLGFKTTHKASVPRHKTIVDVIGYPAGAYKQVHDSGYMISSDELVASRTIAIHGMSGGPMFNSRDELVSIITMNSESISIGIPITRDRIKLIDKYIERYK